MLHRPILYLTEFLSLDWPLLSQYSFIIILAANHCFSAALRISHIAQLLLNLNAKKISGITQWSLHSTLVFPLFEAAITHWFLYCKTKLYWWNNMQYASERHKIKGHIETILACLRIIERDPETGVKIVGIATPIVTCVTGMLREVELVQAHGQHRDDAADEENESPDVEDVVLGMKIVSIGVGLILNHQGQRIIAAKS
jgi:hypothetical protein